ncbi:4059_t:CDS:1 [Racocetra fulgida]|uniref:4059_t:CDS:1 n=1 Tax=Racocetra fulgida TaxID=60492 RepID=A0A9N9G5Z9_9GLOM|nr:4059_t:CDS:1 [Racocetra fulgida]
MNSKFKEYLEKEFKNIKTIEQLPNWIKKQNVNYGLIFAEKNIYSSNFPTFITDTELHINILDESSKKFKAKLNILTKKIDSILLENHINDPNFAGFKYNTDIINKNSIIKNSPVYDIYLEIKCSLVELIFEKKSICPSKDLEDEVKKALENKNPYKELIKVFDVYGHFLPQKIVMGHKLYRKSHLLVNHENNNSIISIQQVEWETLHDFKISKFEELIKHWESYLEKYDFDTKYFISLDGETVMRDKLEKWVEFCLEGNIYPLQIINWCDLYPLYEIFDNPLREDIESILGVDYSKIKEKVLMTGAIPTEKDINYYRVNFFPDSDNHLESNNYQIFGKLIKKDGMPIDKVAVTFKSLNVYGFSAIIESFGIVK